MKNICFENAQRTIGWPVKCIWQSNGIEVLWKWKARGRGVGGKREGGGAEGPGPEVKLTFIDAFPLDVWDTFKFSFLKLNVLSFLIYFCVLILLDWEIFNKLFKIGVFFFFNQFGKWTENSWFRQRNLVCWKEIWFSKKKPGFRQRNLVF